jgi:hypothetical protein
MAKQLRYKISEAARLLGMSVWALRRPSFAARLYGQRRGRKKTKAAIKALQETE